MELAEPCPIQNHHYPSDVLSLRSFPSWLWCLSSSSISWDSFTATVTGGDATAVVITNHAFLAVEKACRNYSSTAESHAGNSSACFSSVSVSIAHSIASAWGLSSEACTLWAYSSLSQRMKHTDFDNSSTTSQTLICLFCSHFFKRGFFCISFACRNTFWSSNSSPLTLPLAGGDGRDPVHWALSSRSCLPWTGTKPTPQALSPFRAISLSMLDFPFLLSFLEAPSGDLLCGRRRLCLNSSFWTTSISHPPQGRGWRRLYLNRPHLSRLWGRREEEEMGLHLKQGHLNRLHGRRWLMWTGPFWQPRLTTHHGGSGEEEGGGSALPCTHPTWADSILSALGAGWPFFLQDLLLTVFFFVLFFKQMFCFLFSSTLAVTLCNFWTYFWFACLSLFFFCSQVPHH